MQKVFFIIIEFFSGLAGVDVIKLTRSFYRDEQTRIKMKNRNPTFYEILEKHEVKYDSGRDSLYYIMKDHLGSIVAAINAEKWFGLVNINGRMYDASLCCFLSPDPYAQMPDYLQNFNRYSYDLNNPLIYTDPSGGGPD